MKTNRLELPELAKRKLNSIIVETIAARKEGARVEHEFISNKHLIHNYGQGQSEIDLAHGCAFIAIKAMMIKIDNNRAHNIAVLGNNINAIITSIQLIKRGFKITLYSEEQFKLLNMSEQTQKSAPKGYKLWFPDGYDWQDDMLKHELFSKYSYDFFQQSIRFHRYRSVHETTVVEFNKTVEELREVVSDLVFDNYRQINLDYGNGQIQPAVAYNTIVVDNSLFMEELKTELVLRGGKFAKKSFSSMNEVLSLQQQIIINCLNPNQIKRIFPDDLLVAKQQLTVDLQVQQRQKGRELNIRLHLQDGDNYQIVERNGNLKIKLPPKNSSQQSNQSFVEKHLFKIDGFFNVRRTKTPKL